MKNCGLGFRGYLCTNVSTLPDFVNQWNTRPTTSIMHDKHVITEDRVILYSNICDLLLSNTIQTM